MLETIILYSIIGFLVYWFVGMLIVGGAIAGTTAKDRLNRLVGFEIPGVSWIALLAVVYAACAAYALLW